jgi:hypothetical protein
VYGNPILVAGNNVELTGFGELSGKWHIKKSTHRIDRSGGYTTDLDLEKTQSVEAGAGASAGSGAAKKKTQVAQGDFIYVNTKVAAGGAGATSTTAGRSSRAGEAIKPPTKQ